jgi:hypothetical protein
VAQVVEVLRYKPEVAGFIPDGVLPAAVRQWIRLSLQHKKVPRISNVGGVKTAGV